MTSSTVVLANIDSALEDHRNLRLALSVDRLVKSAAPGFECWDPLCTCRDGREDGRLQWAYPIEVTWTADHSNFWHFDVEVAYDGARRRRPRFAP